jgi:hypothetical protein
MSWRSRLRRALRRAFDDHETSETTRKIIADATGGGRRKRGPNKHGYSVWGGFRRRRYGGHCAWANRDLKRVQRWMKQTGGIRWPFPADPALVFADIDGVLNSRETYDRHDASGERWPPVRWLEPALIARLDALCARTGARIVVSSGWRTHLAGGWREVAEVLRAAGLRARVVGGTPVAAGPDEERIARRGGEIRAWIAQSAKDNAFVSRWVVLDDCEVDVRPERFVRTDIAVGLTDNDVERAVAALAIRDHKPLRATPGGWFI